MKKISGMIGLGMLMGCGVLPHKPDCITESKYFEKADIDGNGVLAFKLKRAPGILVEVDFTNKTIGEKFRLDMTPSFYNRMTLGVGPVVVAEKRMDKSVVSDSLVLYSLPPGHYEPWFAYTKGGPLSANISLSGEAFDIVPGTITSVGGISINFQGNALKYEQFSIESEAGSLSDEIGRVTARDFNKKAIKEGSVRIVKK